MSGNAGGKVRNLILRLWAQSRHEKRFLSTILTESFKKHPELSDHERADIIRSLRAMIQSERRIDHALVAGAPGKSRLVKSALAHFICCKFLANEITVRQAEAQEPVIDWNAARKADESLMREPSVQNFAIRHSMPDWIASRLMDEYGVDEAGRLAAALNTPPAVVIRANTLRTSRDTVMGQLSKSGMNVFPTKYAHSGVKLDSHINVFKLDSFHEGDFEVQNEGSQLLAELVAPAPRSVVIDYCAGAGGKTLALGAMMRNSGRLIAFDINARKLDELRRRARRAGLHNVQAVLIEDESETSRFKGSAHRVLVDAPCSGLGALAHNPEARWRIHEADIARLVVEQSQIARSAMEFCKLNGRLIYATCSLLKDENEKIVEALLSANDAFELIPPKEVLGGELARQVVDGTGRYVKLLPHIHDTGGFFAAVFRRKR